MKPKHILGIEDLTTQEINDIHRVAREFERDSDAFKPNRYDYLKGKVVYMLFGQSSTRTIESFRTAVESMGGTVRHVDPMKSALMKGESLADCFKMYENNGADMIVARTGCKLRDKDFSNLKIPVISGGDGEEHPTQAVLDALVMADTAGVEDFTKIDGDLLFVGETRGYRAAHSLGLLLTRTGCKVSNLLPCGAKAMHPRWGLETGTLYGGDIIEMEDDLPEDWFSSHPLYERSLRLADDPEVIQEKRMVEEYMKVVADAIQDKDYFYICRPPERGAVIRGLTPEFMDERAKPTMKIMHPGPKVAGELPKSFEGTDRDLFLETQPKAGTRTRQALMALMIGGYEK